MRLLDLFCGAGGAAMGYYQAGFIDITGVDIAPQPRYPFRFVQDDALAYVEKHGHEYDVIHASPPCQAYCNLSKGDHPRLIQPTRDRLAKYPAMTVIENVVNAPLLGPIMLCGSMFQLRVRRHRLFELSWFTLAPSCAHGSQQRIRAYYGKKGWAAWTPAAANVQRKGRLPLLRGSEQRAQKDMGIDWMTWDELREAIPPAYTRYIGAQLRRHMQHADV